MRLFNRRPFLITPWSIWIKPRLKIPFIAVWAALYRGEDEQGRIRVELIDDFDRVYWLRLTPRQFDFVQRRTQ